MDFVSDSLFDGRRFRAFTLVENSSRECLAIRPAPKIFGSDVAEVLDGVVETHGKPGRIFLDNGPEFISKALDHWAYQAGVTLDFSRPGKWTRFLGQVRWRRPPLILPSTHKENSTGSPFGSTSGLGRR
jgi:putative transposase